MAQLLSDRPRWWPRPLCLFWRTLSFRVVGSHSSSDRPGGIAEILVVAWDGFCFDLLSCDDGTVVVCRGAADDYIGFSRRDGRAGHGHDGVVGYYLGDRRHVEDEQAPQLSSGRYVAHLRWGF